MINSLLDHLRFKLSIRKGAERLLNRREQACGKWDSHLKNSREFICQTAKQAGNKTAVIMGSGHLLDVPIEELSKMFDEVLLVDIYHPAKAVSAAKQFSNVKLKVCDVTGVTMKIASAGRRAMPLPASRPPSEFNDADFVVSLNLLSQLPVWPHAFLTNFSKLDDREIDTHVQKLVEDHLEWLKGMSGTVCLIYDRERQVCNAKHTTETMDLLFGAAPPPAQKRWVWDIAPQPIVYPDRDVRHIVEASRL